MTHADARAVMRWLMAIFYGVAGMLHVVAPEPFLAITPAWVPAPRAVVAITGACEILGAAALLTTSLRRAAGAMLALYAVCVFPANVTHAWSAIHVPGLPSGWWYHGPRLALQPVLVWWALFGAGVVDWPFASRSGR